MTVTLGRLLLLVAALCWFLLAFGVGVGKVHLGWLGAAFIVAGLAIDGFAWPWNSRGN